MKVQQIERKFSWLLTLGALMLLAVAIFAANGARPAQASASSFKVAVVGQPNCMFGGGLPTTGVPFSSFNFANVAPGNVSTDVTFNTAPNYFDTVLLNVCSPQMHCDPDTLTGTAKTALGTFVSKGGKLIIYDSECVGGQLGHPANYTWLPFPFTTTFTSVSINGTLTIDEQNILSKSPPGPYYIDVASMSLLPFPDNSEVGDADFMATLDPHWCLDMSATRVSGETGPVHTYARYGSGLMIYNGLDLDTALTEATPPAPNGLQKIWLQELQVPLSPTVAELPCGVPVVPAPCAASGGLDISTGTNGIGNVDPIWTLSAAPALVPIPNAYGVSRPSSWVLPGSPANWIDPNNTGGSASDPGGDYVYETSFFVPAGAPSLVVNFNFAVDNDVLFSLTDTMSSHLIESLTALPATPAGHFNMLHPVSYSLPGPLPAGTYTLVAKVTNQTGTSYPGTGNPVGLLVEGTVSCGGPVGGVAALTVSSSGSPFPWMPLAAVAASVVAVLAVGGWYGRKRWLR